MTEEGKDEWKDEGGGLMADSGQHGRRCKWMMGGTSGEMRVAGMAMRVWVAGTTGVVGREASDSAGNGMARAAGCSSDLSTRSSTSLSSLWQISTTKSGMQLLSTVTPPMVCSPDGGVSLIGSSTLGVWREVSARITPKLFLDARMEYLLETYFHFQYAIFRMMGWSIW